MGRRLGEATTHGEVEAKGGAGDAPSSGRTGETRIDRDVPGLVGPSMRLRFAEPSKTASVPGRPSHRSSPPRPRPRAPPPPSARSACTFGTVLVSPVSHLRASVGQHGAMDDGRLAVFARGQGGLVTAAQLKACGLSSSGIAYRVRTHRLFVVRRRVYALTPVVDVNGLRWAAVLAAGADAALSHWSAADVHGFSTGRRAEPDVTVPGTGGRPIDGLRVHRARRLRDGDVVLVDGLRVTSPSRTILDIAAGANDTTLRRLIREAEFVGCLRIGDLAAAVAGRGGHAGVGRIRRVDPATREMALAQTPLEDAMAALIDRLPLPAPLVQHPVGAGFGAGYRADFAWPLWRLIVEADGRAAHARASSLESDRARDADLSAHGWLVLRFTRIQVLTEQSRVGDRIVRTALQRGWVPSAVRPAA